MATLPRFRVHRIEEDPLRLVGEVSATEYQSETWIHAGWLGDLRVGNHFIAGRWSEAGTSWAFAPEDPHARDKIGEARDFEVFEGYWGERASLVLDESLDWHGSSWSDPIDHDHCRICWATINSQENAQHFAASENLRVCPRCHSSYVQRRSIDFTALGGPAA
ncbi:MAG: hypothetical protein E6J87_11175 [Deltaproteobacteria bacterium]|nr:MAG: hypothetical protein E6J87_11175 [Deltaproteobacteria bacterium]